MTWFARWRWAALVLLGVTFLLSFWKPDDSQRLVLWHAYDEGEAAALRQVLDRFEAREGVVVHDVRLPFGVLASRLESAVRTGNGPDLFIDAHERMERYVAGAVVQPFDPSSALNDALDELESAHVDALSRAGAVYGAPLSAKALALYVNRTLAPDVPANATLDERLRAGFPEGVWPLITEAENAYYAAPFFHAFGARLFDPALVFEDARVFEEAGVSERTGGYEAASEAGAAALQRIATYFREGLLPPEPSGALVGQLFGSGQAAYAISGPWLAPQLPDDLAYDVLPLPALDGAGVLQPYVTLEAVFRAARSSHPASTDLAAFLVGEESALLRAREGRQVVSHRRAWDSLADEPQLLAFRRAAAGGIVMPSHRRMSQVFEPTTRAIREVVRGGGSPEDALDSAQARFLRSVEALPEARDPAPALVVVGLLLLLVMVQIARRMRDATFRTTLAASRPAYRYVALAGVAVLLLVIGPLVVGAFMSLFATDGVSFRYVGLTHYASILSADGLSLFANGSFWRVLLITLVWTALNLVLHVAIGVALALALHRPGLKFRALYRVLLIVPWAVPNYVTALSWKGMFHSQYGAVNALIEAAGGESIQWFSRFATAFSANVTTNVWLGFPFMMVVALGALSSVPKELYDAAKVDGATPWQRFRYVAWPMLWPTMIPAIALGAVWTFNMFNVVFLVSGGEPGGSTEILVSEAYRWAFTRGARYGYAAAYAVLIFGVLWLSTRSQVVRKALQ
ncbi:MAG: extracellular solute-binding protein [Myxococcota bacterium]